MGGSSAPRILTRKIVYALNLAGQEATTERAAELIDVRTTTCWCTDRVDSRVSGYGDAQLSSSRDHYSSMKQVHDNAHRGGVESSLPFLTSSSYDQILISISTTEIG